jgi:hypothetical protein
MDQPDAAPMPVVVGVPRSGTTLLRLMLDSHPQLSIPPETWFLGRLEQLNGQTDAGVDVLIETITGCDTWPDFGLSAEALRAALSPGDPTGAARAFYRLYAERHGKPRWGDKTPTHEIDVFERLLPEARFVHLIRDGRDVVASLRHMWFAPSRDIGVLAAFWRDGVVRTRVAASKVERYVELRYEHLVADPEPHLRQVCAFVDLPFDVSMLAHHRGAAQRLAEHQGRVDATGRVLLTREQRLQQQRNSVRPPDPSLIGRWRTLLTRDELRHFEEEAGELLDELGYR